MSDHSITKTIGYLETPDSQVLETQNSTFLITQSVHHLISQVFLEWLLEGFKKMKKIK